MPDVNIKIVYKLVRTIHQEPSSPFFLDDGRQMGFFQLFDEVRETNRLHASVTDTSISDWSSVFPTIVNGPFAHTRLSVFERFPNK
jgi:hypothetical protein